MLLREDGIARRCDLNLMTPAELAIHNAMLAVEEMPASPLLTDAVLLLGQAKDKVADFAERHGESTWPLRDHLIGLTTGRCLRCGEATHRIQSHPNMKCA